MPGETDRANNRPFGFWKNRKKRTWLVNYTDDDSPPSPDICTLTSRATIPNPSSHLRSPFGIIGDRIVNKNLVRRRDFYRGWTKSLSPSAFPLHFTITFGWEFSFLTREGVNLNYELVEIKWMILWKSCAIITGLRNFSGKYIFF